MANIVLVPDIGFWIAHRVLDRSGDGRETQR
jgi:hypothetical protein